MLHNIRTLVNINYEHKYITAIYIYKLKAHIHAGKCSSGMELFPAGTFSYFKKTIYMC